MAVIGTVKREPPDEDILVSAVSHVVFVAEELEEDALNSGCVSSEHDLSCVVVSDWDAGDTVGISGIGLGSLG
jgi:hypothetical protein